MHGSPKCPILLLKHEHRMLSACGCKCSQNVTGWLDHKESFLIHTFIIFAHAFLNCILFIIWICFALECNISSRWIRYHLHIDVLFQCIKSSIGVREVGGLVTLRARQLLHEKWKGQSAIFLLAHNATSSIYRPALASVVLGKQTDLLWQAASWTCQM